MLIRSQDKSILINMNNVSSIEVGDDRLRIFANNGDAIYDIGEYSTEAKVIKVLDMIQEAYANEKLVDYTTYLQQKEIEKMDNSTILALRNELMKKAVFQMPEDSGVEA
nr:MAG TPA: hypothetical protein [Caudoviricetes sp.]